MRPTTLIVDWGGVLTTPIAPAWREWAERNHVDVTAFDTVMGEMLGGDGEPAKMSAAFERGEVSDAEFETFLARCLLDAGAGELPDSGVMVGLWQSLSDQPTMVEVVRRARLQGLKTALLSNSWGVSGYDREGWGELFDATVLSGEVGLRKPDTKIFHLTAARLGVAPAECVFVDDLVVNVAGAADAGMIGVHHVAIAETVDELEAIFDLKFDIAPPPAAGR